MDGSPQDSDSREPRHRHPPVVRETGKTRYTAEGVGGRVPRSVFYGDRGREVLDESAAAGSGFLPEVCHAWEAAVTPARERGIRVVHLRIGIVLSPLGGALAQMLKPFKLGAGGVLGGGDQYMSWIAIDDLLSIVQHALIDDSVSGPVNAVAPQAVTNREFTKTLGAVLRRPTYLPAPGLCASPRVRGDGGRTVAREHAG